MKINEYYDVFISFKDSDGKGNDTEDKAIANDLYEYLSSKKLKVFFSAKTFVEHGTDEWSNELKDAMNVSKVFIALSTNREYMESKHLIWERTFFSALRSRDNSRVLYSYISSPMKLDDLPNDMSVLSSFTPQNKEHLLTYIRNHLGNIKVDKVDKRTKLEKLFDSIFLMIIPFIITFISLISLSYFIYPSLDLKDIFYAFLVISFILSKIFLLLKERI